MLCSWNAFINLLPCRFREEVDKLGKKSLQEVRLRIGAAPELVMQDRNMALNTLVSPEDLKHSIHFASQYSPWSTETVNQGYITAPGGHRVGVFGQFSKCSHGWSLQVPTSLCLRVARDFDGISNGLHVKEGSILIIGPPGTGKTTLLRDLIRQYSSQCKGNISVIDEREELFPRYKGQLCFKPGARTDVLSGCTKKTGIEWALRNMTPSVIAVDEITAYDDCETMLHAGWCGVRLFATAHAGDKLDLYARPAYKQILEHNLFQTLLVMHRDKKWHTERICS